MPYYLSTNEKKTNKAKQGGHDIISQPALLICINKGVYAYINLSPIDFNMGRVSTPPSKNHLSPYQ
jgi:hypothetical protein